MLVTPGLGIGRRARFGPGRCGHRGGGRGGAIPHQIPPSKTVPLEFHVRSAHISDETVSHESHIFYKITVGAIGNCTWDVYRRYSDFYHLYERVSYLEIDIDHPFPPRHWFSFIISLSDEEQHERLKGLEKWFSTVISIVCGDRKTKKIINTYDMNQLKVHLMEFLEVNEHFYAALRNSGETLENLIIPQDIKCENNAAYKSDANVGTVTYNR